jgi:hypothetical protein
MLASLVGVIIYLVWKYTETTVIEETTTTLPIPVLIFIAGVILIFSIAVSVVILLSYWEYIKIHKFSFISMSPISILIFGMTVFSRLLINKIRVLVEINVEQFMIDMTTYKGSTTVILTMLGAGFIIGLIGFIYENATNT